MSVELSWERRGRIVALALSVVSMMLIVACGSASEGGSGNQADGSPNDSTDSLPAQTSLGDDDREASATSALDLSTAESASAATSVPPSTLPSAATSPPTVAEVSVAPGATRFLAEGFSEFSGRRVGLIASRASVVDGRSVIDLLAEHEDVDLVAIFTPEHGLRADGGAGELIDDTTDPVTGLPVFSLYGATRQPTGDMLADLDVLLFDLQDVGARYYTYTATMGLAMQSAAEARLSFVVLDRPNPLGGQMIDGATRDDGQVSFVSQYPIPALHGMTTGELALAIKGEGWLPGLESLDLQIVELAGWDRERRWPDTGLPWLPPSPGLPTVDAALIYPATVLFEASSLSYGRGTDHPFQQIGAPWLDGQALADSLNGAGLAGVRFVPTSFVPVTDPPNGPPTSNPQYEGTEVFGVRLEIVDQDALRPTSIGMHLLAAVLAQARDRDPAVEVIERAEFFDLLAGSPAVRNALLAGERPEVIVDSWSGELAAFDAVRSRYLLY